MELKFKSLSGSLPTYATDGASGMDLRAFIDEPVILKPINVISSFHISHLFL